jgi:hypothetical protein
MVDDGHLGAEGDFRLIIERLIPSDRFGLYILFTAKAIEVLPKVEPSRERDLPSWSRGDDILEEKASQELLPSRLAPPGEAVERGTECEIFVGLSIDPSEIGPGRQQMGLMDLLRPLDVPSQVG